MNPNQHKAEPLVRADAASNPAEDKLAQILAGITTVTTRMDSEAQTRADSEKAMMDRLDSMCKRLDACESDMKTRKDAEEEKCRKDAEEKERKDAEDKKAAEEKERKDSEEAKAKEEKERADAAAAAANPDVMAAIRALESRIPVELSETDRAQFVSAQSRCERVAQAFGDSAGAPRWLSGETLPQYQRRLLGSYKQHSAAWKDKDLTKVDASVLDIAETQIYADAMTAAIRPANVAAGTLIERVETDRTGRKISKFSGDPEACWGPFKQPARRVSGFQTKFH
ncbi:MAG TPA: hypothetical protein VI653_04985 [Steroidobacteraceae bacterium]